MTSVQRKRSQEDAEKIARYGIYEHDTTILERKIGINSTKK